MLHVDSPTLDSLAASRTISLRATLHIDRCVRCRHAALERGVAAETIAANAATARAGRNRNRAVAAAAVVVAGAVAALPLRGAALGFISVFEPHTVTAIPLTLDDLRRLGRMNDLSAYASTREFRSSTGATFADARTAAAAAGFPLRQPAAIPNGLRAVSYTVNSPSGQLVTFASHATSAHGGLSALPADIAGSTLRVDIGSTVIATYQTAETIADEARMARALSQINAQATQTPTSPLRSTPPGTLVGSYQARVVHGRIVESRSSTGNSPHIRFFTTSTHQQHVWGFHVSHGGQPGQGSMPLVVVQMPVPHIASTGVSVQRIFSYMLSAPDVPPRVAAAFGALGDMSTTLPIPVPIDKAFTQPVLVDGVTGVGIGDDTGLGAAVIWQKNGMLYAVFATQPAQTVLAIANSLR